MISECSEGTGKISSYIDKKAETERYWERLEVRWEKVAC